MRLRAQNGALSWSTYENYEGTVRLVLALVCGGLTLEALTVGRCDRIIQGLLAERGVSAARKARSALSLSCGFAVRDDAIAANPVRDVARLQTLAKKTVLLFPTKAGRPMSVSNYERLLRSFIQDNDAAPRALGVDVEHYSTHLYRRTVATLVKRAARITVASCLLGHANEQIAPSSYIVTVEQVDPVTVDILDAILGE